MPIEGLEKLETLVVQIKSYKGQHHDLTAVDQIETGIKEFNADAGLLITTAEKTEKIQKAIEDLSNRIKKPISLIAGVDVAKFVLKYYGDLN